MGRLRLVVMNSSDSSGTVSIRFDSYLPGTIAFGETGLDFSLHFSEISSMMISVNYIFLDLEPEEAIFSVPVISGKALFAFDRPELDKTILRIDIEEAFRFQMEEEYGPVDLNIAVSSNLASLNIDNNLNTAVLNFNIMEVLASFPAKQGHEVEVDAEDFRDIVNTTLSLDRLYGHIELNFIDQKLTLSDVRIYGDKTIKLDFADERALDITFDDLSVELDASGDDF